MTDERHIQELSAIARQDSPPAVDVADAVLAELSASARPSSQRVMGAFAMAASLLAVAVVMAALWTGSRQRDLRITESDFFADVPSLVATVQP